jgi:hypothetical protein
MPTSWGNGRQTQMGSLEPGEPVVSFTGFHGGPGQSPDGYRALKICEGGGPGQSPTADLRVRSALLYATELPGLLR